MDEQFPSQTNNGHRITHQNGLFQQETDELTVVVFCGVCLIDVVIDARSIHLFVVGVNTVGVVDNQAHFTNYGD